MRLHKSRIHLFEALEGVSHFQLASMGNGVAGASRQQLEAELSPLYVANPVESLSLVSGYSSRKKPIDDPIDLRASGLNMEAIAKLSYVGGGRTSGWTFHENDVESRTKTEENSDFHKQGALIATPSSEQSWKC